jgi:DNA modification methylase
MVATMIEISTDPEDIVLDPFAGSGSVLFQSTVMKRNYIGFELNQDYINMFTRYLKANKINSEREYIQLQQLGSQEEFKKNILNLRALKFGRLLINEIERIFNIDLKVFVKIIEYYNDYKIHIKVEYQIIGVIHNKDLVLNEIETLINKPPLSKFGIKAIFNFFENINLENTKYYYYTKTNSYSFSDLSANSPKIKVISQICTNLNENDYK